MSHRRRLHLGYVRSGIHAVTRPRPDPRPLSLPGSFAVRGEVVGREGTPGEGRRIPEPAARSFGEPYVWPPERGPIGPRPRASLRISANDSTLDSIQTSLPPHPSTDGSNVEGGATYNRHKLPGESQSGARNNGPTGAISTCHSQAAEGRLVEVPPSDL